MQGPCREPLHSAVTNHHILASTKSTSLISLVLQGGAGRGHTETQLQLGGVSARFTA